MPGRGNGSTDRHNHADPLVVGLCHVRGSASTGGFARSVINFDARARPPAAGAFIAIGIALAWLFLTPLLLHQPIAVLTATFIVVILSLASFDALAQA
nr:SulP family inorganic anion transporter [Paracoccus saliphilus]